MPKIKAAISKHNQAVHTRRIFNNAYLRQRELGIRMPMGHADQFHKTIYTSTTPITSWDINEQGMGSPHGAVFNLEFSPDGTMLVGACEKRSILMFDPLTRKSTHTITDAHLDCVNGVKFLDTRQFATCSDDSTVSLWDARNLKSRMRQLQGHSNWVKNIEYSKKDRLLITSGFDGVVYTWELDNPTENSCVANRVFNTNGLMRTKLSPCGTKLLICTTSGYIIIIHDLDLKTLGSEVNGFKPNMYRLMQLSQTTIPAAACFTHLFYSSRTKNRIEFITDFPDDDDAEVISSLQIHPQGWCALTRNVSANEKNEWTCIHDIQLRSTKGTLENMQNIASQKYRQKYSDVSNPPPVVTQFGDFDVENVEENETQQPSRSGITSSFQIDNANSSQTVNATDAPSGSFSARNLDCPARPSRHNTCQINLENERRRNRGTTRADNYGVFVEMSGGAENSNEDAPVDAEEAHEESSRRNPRRNYAYNYRVRFNNGDNDNVELHVNTNDVWEALIAIREARLSREREREFSIDPDRRLWTQTVDGVDSYSIPRQHTVVIYGDRSPPPFTTRNGAQTMYAIPRNHKIYQNVPRLTHYKEEPNVGSGYIKELSFSKDGRLISSPYGKGVRLLGFSGQCQELSDVVPSHNETFELVEIATSFSHNGIVVSTKFSPTHCLLVSGCLNGRIVWYQPVL